MFALRFPLYHQILAFPALYNSFFTPIKSKEVLKDDLSKLHYFKALYHNNLKNKSAFFRNSTRLG